MSQDPLLDFTGAADNLDPKVKKCLVDYKKIQAEFQALFEYQERVQKEFDYVKSQSRKGKVVTTMPPAKVGEKETPILSSVDKMKKKSEIDKSMKKLTNFQTFVQNLIKNPGEIDSAQVKQIKDVSKQLTSLQATAKRKVDYLDKDLAKTQKTSQIGGPNSKAFTGTVDDGVGFQMHQMEQLAALKAAEDEVDNLHTNYQKKTDVVIDTTNKNLQMIQSQGEQLKGIDKKNAHLQKQTDLADKTITQMNQAVYCKRVFIRLVAIMFTLINIMLFFKILFV